MTAVMEQWHRRMNMDFSPLHTYTPPQCAPDNTGYTYSLSSSYSLAALEFEQEHHIAPVYDSPRMSRKSLRLHTATGLYGNDGLDEQSHNHSVSYSSSSASGSTRRTVRSRRQQQQQQQSSAELQTDSQTLTLTQTQTPIRRTLRSHSSYVLGQAQTDASLSGSLLDGASLKEHATSTPKVWGTELEADLKAGRSVRTEHSSSSRVNGNASVTHSHTTVANGYICRDCSLHGENKDALTAYSSSGTSSSSSSSSTSAAALASAVAGGDAGLHRTSSSTTTSIYSSKRSQKHRTGVLACVSGACLHQSRRALTSVFTFITLLFHRLLGDSSGHTQQQDSSKGVLVSVLDTLWGAGAAFWESVRVLKWRLQQRLFYRNPQPKAHSSYCGSMNVKDLVTGDGHLNLNGSLCDDCKGSQHLESHTLHTHSSRRRGLLGALLALLTYTGAGVLQVCRAIASIGANVTRKLLALLWLVLLAPGKAAKAAFWWLGAAWYQFITLMSLLNVFFLTRCLPKLWKLLPFLLAFLLLLGLWYLGPSSLLGLLPVVNLTEWSSESQYSLLPSSSLFPAADAPMEQAPPLPPISSPTPATPSVQQLSLRSSMWWSRRLTRPRLAELEILLQALAAKTEEVQHGQKDQEAEAAVPPPPVSVGVGQEEHDALLQQVGRLEAELGRIRDDLQGVMGCRGRCEQLDTLKETVSAQVSAQVSAGVRRELQALFYGGEAGAVADDARLPESLLQWLSARFVRGDDLHASLAALEKSILGNVSLQLEQNRQPACAETVTQSVTHTALAAGMNEQDVHLIVQNALRLYSQDRTGKVDYALESGGGSILSTRCSETYETKTALMSLFGLPLWYFSQSPRVVIQPDVYPGNCWAFKGSQGYLVIRLSLSVLPSSFCLEHIPKALSPTGSISSAPRHFTVYGLEDEYQEEGKLLGDYTYEEDGESLQTFPVMEKNDQAFQIIEMRVLSNWGHPEYTCLYRFRVHGEPKLK
ncbi:SUN domain-containing protein 1-like [Alosa alosa]|uniref:SUN domain-containing protein 1-like n=1 Tax=Alosa alosa TaxID=278164 RepID=UPI00201536E0|nr:SUN domain-containing protein 1-like [Alosa alosa]